MDLPAATQKNRLKWLFWIFFLGTLMYMFWMKRYLLPLESGEIIRFEMAKTTGKAAVMINEWKRDGKFDLVVKSIYLDYIFILLYTFAISIACRFLSGVTRNHILIKTGNFFAVFVFVAGLFDAAENIAMAKSLGQSVTEIYVGVAYKMAISKFSIVLMSLFFIVICFITWLANQFSRKENFLKSFPNFSDRK